MTIITYFVLGFLPGFIIYAFGNAETMNLNLEVNKEVIEDIRDVAILAKFFEDEFKKLESLQSNII